jgi:hypothetical protein
VYYKDSKKGAGNISKYIPERKTETHEGYKYLDG